MIGQKGKKIKSESVKCFVNECLLSVKDIALLLSLSERTVYRMIASGVITGAVRIGRCRRYPSSIINNLLENLKEVK